MKNVPDEGLRVIDQAAVDEADLGRLPDEVQLALAEIAEVAREDLLALSVTTGLAVLGEMMEAERTGLCGPAHVKDPDRGYVRGGGTQTSVVLGGRRVPIRRLRVRAADGSGEVPLETFTVASDGDLLTAVAMERMPAGVSTRKYERVDEPVGPPKSHDNDPRIPRKSHLCVGRFDEAVGNAPFEGTFDRGAVLSDAAGEFDEGGDTAAGRPGEPLVELVEGLTVGQLGYLAEDLLELPGPGAGDPAWQRGCRGVLVVRG